jgi:NitT/TauT family transport system permease protein
MPVKSSETVDVLIQNPTPGNVRLKRKNQARPVIVALLGAIGVLAIWQAIIVGLKVPEYLVPAPTAVWGSLTSDFALLMQNAWPTLVESVVGFLLGNGIAVGLAIIFVHNKTLEQIFYPMAVVVRTIPIIAIAPILVLLLGSGLTPKVAIAALISFFPTLVNMVRGLESVDKQALELMHVLSASKTEVFFKLRLISSLPYLFAALKISTGACVVGAIVAEWIGSDTGLGVLVVNATYQFRTPLLYATMVVASVMALVFFALVVLLERLIVRWETESETV